MSAERQKILSYWESKNSHKKSQSKWEVEEIWINFDDSEISETNSLIELYGIHVVVEDGREYVYFMTDYILKLLSPTYFQDLPNNKQAMIVELMLHSKGESCGFKNSLFDYVMGMQLVFDDSCENAVYTRSCPILVYNGEVTEAQEKEKVEFLRRLREALFLYLAKKKSDLMEENKVGRKEKKWPGFGSEGSLIDEGLELEDDESLGLDEGNEDMEDESFDTESSEEINSDRSGSLENLKTGNFMELENVKNLKTDGLKNDSKLDEIGYNYHIPYDYYEHMHSNLDVDFDWD